jgi:Dyp-type peroxidase family
VRLELDDIQRGVLHPRPSPYAGAYLLLRIDVPDAGRRLLDRLLPLVATAASPPAPHDELSLAVALTYRGLAALGLPPESLESFAPEFRAGMAARAEHLGDRGESAPDRWERPLGSGDVHVALAVLAPDARRMLELRDRARRAQDDLPGVEVIWRQECYQLPGGHTSFGFKDGIGQPAIEGTGLPGGNPAERPIRAGEFVLGYADETGAPAPMPSPEILGRNGTYLVFRKLRTRVAAYRRYLRERTANRAEEALLGAKMVGRWPSGAPLALAPEHDDPALGADAGRNDAFGYADDVRGFKCPAGAHARRANPRDALEHELGADVRLHRMIRRGTSYGPLLPPGALADDGADRGIVFVFIGTHLDRQFEFVKTQWLNDGVFIGTPAERDPLVGPNDGSGTFTIPRRPIRRRLPNVPPLVVTRGGEYCFAPGLRALRWLVDRDP